MSVFKDYAKYYDLLYKDKDYKLETEFVLDILGSRLGKIADGPNTILDLGCGTGNHVFEMCELGYAVTGLDMSASMVDIANVKLTEKSCCHARPEFYQKDAREFELNRKFDAAVSLFHVMSYQTTEKDLLAVLASVKRHLETNGLFFFDFWYGPGVLKHRPESRKKYAEDKFLEIERHSTPQININQNTVDVHFDVTIRDKAKNTVYNLQEDHKMRYWFLPELKFLAESAGFVFVDCGGWAHNQPASDADWHAWVLLQNQ